MIRIIAEFILPILAPALIYAMWLSWERRRVARLGHGDPPRWQDAPWLWLAGGGLALALALSVAATLGLTRSDIAGTYVPPRSVDGRVVPGHVEPTR
jgi:ABC-type Fe3+ transport system permease subunit